MWEKSSNGEPLFDVDIARDGKVTLGRVHATNRRDSVMVHRRVGQWLRRGGKLQVPDDHRGPVR